MSKIEVDKIDPQSGTALELGSSGDTITVPSGATLAIASGATIANSGTTTGFPEYDDDAIQSNIAMLGFKVAVNGSLTRYNLVDQSIDEFFDTSGVDASASTNESRSLVAPYYYFGGGAGTGPTGGASTGTYSHGGKTYSFNKFTADTNLITSDQGIADVFLIGGGGAAVGDNGGGGGAGGLIWKPGHSFTGSTTFAIDIGTGGVGAAGGASSGVGADTTLATTTFVAKGGGYGGSYGVVGGAGGSGGGGGRQTGSVPGATTQSSQSGDSGTYGFGFAGGTGRNDAWGPGAGGGGSGAVGADGVSGTVGNGGAGKTDFVNSSATETTAFLLALTAGTDSSNVATDGSSTGTLYIGGGGSGGTQARATHPGGGVGGVGGGASIGDASNGVAGLANTGSGGSSTTGGGTGGDGGTGLAIIRYLPADFTVTGEDLTLQSTDVTAEAEPSYGDMVCLIENAAGTATLNTDIKGYVSCDSGVTFAQGTLVDEGTWGTNKQILAFHDLDISAQTGTSMCYKITTHNQSAAKETRIYATSIGWR